LLLLYVSVLHTKSCSDYVKGYNEGYSSTCGKNRDGRNNIQSSISSDLFYTDGWIGGKNAATHDSMINAPVTTRPNQTMQNCPRTYCQGYRSSWNDGYQAYLSNGTFSDPTSDALQWLTKIGTITGDKLYFIIYYSPAEIHAVYNKIYHHIIKSFEVIPQNSSIENATSVSTYENRNYGIQIQYPSDWSIQESAASGIPINIATFVSPIGPDSDPTADVSIYLDKLHNSTTTLNNYAHFVAFADYENRTSDFHAFKLLELSTNSLTLAGKPAYTLIGTDQNPSAGLQKLMEIGTIIGDKAYSVQYIADAPKYSDYLPIVQKMIDSLVIKKSLGTGSGSMLDNNLEKCYGGLCYIMWTRHC
jgi:hypothetical protein